MRYEEGKLEKRKSLGEGEREKMKVEGPWAYVFFFLKCVPYNDFIY